jgi:hypothetical protein
MKDTLSRISNLLIITAVFLYFTAWVYVHFYFGQFGLTTGSLKIDYSTYLVYSYNVFFSFQFLYILIPLLILWLAVQVILYRTNKFKDMRPAYASMHRRIRTIRVTIGRNKFGFLVLLMLIAFPPLFICARAVALSDYDRDRFGKSYLKKVQFIFNKGAEWLSSDTVVVLPPEHQRFKQDIARLKYDTADLLRLLAESDNYFFVLLQGPYDKRSKTFPEANVFLINKKDVLLSKIIITP